MTLADTPAVFNDAILAEAMANAPAVLYGNSGAGKSTLAVTLAEYIYERSAQLYGPRERRILRYVGFDSGGFPMRLAALAKYGVVELYRARNHAEPSAVCDYVAKGRWPVTLDPQTGFAPDNVAFAPPVVTTYQQMCGQCGQVVYQAYSGQSLVARECPTCRILVSPTSVRILQAANPTFRHVGGLFIDGVTAMQDFVLEELERAAAKNLLGGEKAAIGGTLKSGDEFYAGNSRSHVGFAQVRAQLWFSYSANIPGLMVPVYYTALEDRGSDDKNAGIYGPKIAGQARTYQVPNWNGHCLYLRQQGYERRIYLQTVRFADEGNVDHLAKVRADPGAMPEFLSDYDYETNQWLPAFTRFSLGYFHQLLDESAQLVGQDVAAKYGEARASIASGAQASSSAVVEQLQQTLAQAAAQADPATAHPAIPAGASVAAAGLPRAAAPRGRGRRTPAPVHVPQADAPPAEPVVVEEPAQVVAAIAAEAQTPAYQAEVAAAQHGAGTVAHRVEIAPGVYETTVVNASAVASHITEQAPGVAVASVTTTSPTPPANGLPVAAPRRSRSLTVRPGAAAQGSYAPVAPVAPVDPTLPPPTARPAAGPPRVG